MRLARVWEEIGTIQTGGQTQDSKTQIPGTILKGKVAGFQEDVPKTPQILS